MLRQCIFKCLNLNIRGKIKVNNRLRTFSYLKYCQCRFYCSEQLKQNPTASNEDSKYDKSLLEYTTEQKAHILKVMNESTFEELMPFVASKARVTKIIRHRAKTGNFKDIDEFLEVDSFGIKVLEKVCNAIIEGTGTNKKSQLSKRRSCEPQVGEELKKNLESIVSIRILSDKVMWLHINRNLEILDWTLKPFEKQSFSNPPHINLNTTNSILKILPSADAYIMEQRQVKAKYLSIVPAMCTLLQIESMLMAKLSHTTSVFFIKSHTVDNFFQIRLGNERVSGKKVVDRLLRELHCHNLRQVTADNDVIEWYYGQSTIDKEELGNCLLQAVAFYELEISN